MNKYKLSDIADFDASKYSLKEAWVEVDYLDTGSVTKGVIESIQHIDLNNDKLPSRAKVKVKKNTIIYSTVRPIQEHYAIINDVPSEHFLVSTGFSTIDVNPLKANPFYVYYLLTRKDTIKRLQTIATATSSYPSITSDDIKELTFNFPNLNDQNNIVKILNKLDSKISINNKINYELELLAKTIYDYWFLQFEFPNEDGKPYKSSSGKMAWNEELKREIPDGWKVKTIGDIIVENNKSSIQVNEALKKGMFPFFTSGNSILRFNDFFVDDFNCFLSTGGNPNIKGYKGKCAYSTDTWCISANEYSYLLYYYLLKMLPQFEQLFFAGSGLKHLQKDVLKSKYIIIPSNECIEQFNKLMCHIWNMITNRILENQELASLRDFLLPLLMNQQAVIKD